MASFSQRWSHIWLWEYQFINLLTGAPLLAIVLQQLFRPTFFYVSVKLVLKSLHTS